MPKTFKEFAEDFDIPACDCDKPKEKYWNGTHNKWCKYIIEERKVYERFLEYMKDIRNEAKPEDIFKCMDCGFEAPMEGMTKRLQCKKCFGSTYNSSLR